MGVVACLNKKDSKNYKVISTEAGNLNFKISHF